MVTEGRNGKLALIWEMKASGVSCNCRGVHTVRSPPFTPLSLGTRTKVKVGRGVTPATIIVEGHKAEAVESTCRASLKHNV